MSIVEARIRHFRAFADSGLLNFGSFNTIVGQNDAGKSGILHALRVFFNPPKKGGIPLYELHCKDDSYPAQIEVAFDVDQLSYPTLSLKDQVISAREHLTDPQGLLRLRLTVSSAKVDPLEIYTREGSWQDTRTFGGEKGIRELLPPFHFFSDTVRYDINATTVQNQFRGVIDRALAQHPAAQQIQQDIALTLQAEFDKVFHHLQSLTPAVTNLQADPQVNWRKAIESITLSWQDGSGIELPYEQRGAGIRRLFMVAYFQYEAEQALTEQQGSRCLFVLEEPEINLHPGAQRHLIAALKTLSEQGHTVILTTHSPVFAAAAPAAHLMLVQRQAHQTNVIQGSDLDLTQVASDLGIEVSDRLIGKNYVILVEGSSDVYFYGGILKKLYQAGLVNLDPQEILFLQCGGIGNIQFMITESCMDKAGLHWAVLTDSDEDNGNAQAHQKVEDIQNHSNIVGRFSYILKRTCIENYLCPAAIQSITHIQCNVPTSGKLLYSDTQKPLSKTHLKKIKSNMADIIESMILDTILSQSLDPDIGESEWIGMFESIRTSFSL